MAARYRGTCIGGVADGHYIERDDPEIKISARRKAPNQVEMEFKDKEEILHEDVYRFLILLATPNDEIGVWALHGMTIEQVVHRLVKCYNPRTGLIGTPAANVLPIRKQ